MKAPTHIAGGIVFTGSMCSLFNVNLFESWYYTIACILFSLLPDIDTTKSVVGKLVYPLASWINRTFGHRTLTHSFLMLFVIYFILKVLLFFGILEDDNIIKIALFAYSSHLIIDMLTVSGIQGFYPFKRNACVLPGNPNYRFKTGEVKSELIVSAICIGLCVTLQPLFANGFWTTYNRQFATVKHVHRENNNTNYYTICDYSYIDNNEEISGTALVIESKENEITLFNNGNLFTINADNHKIKINYTRPRSSTIPKRYEEIQFFNISLDSIQSLLNSNICSGLIQSNYNVQFTDQAIQYNTNFIQLKNKYNFHLFAATDTTSKSIAAQLTELEAARIEEQRKYNNELNKYNEHFAQITEVEQSLQDKSLDLYERNKLQNQLIKLKAQKIDKPTFEPSLRTQAKIDEIRKAMSERSLLFSGHLTTLVIVDPAKPEIREQYEELNPDDYVAKASIFTKH